MLQVADRYARFRLGIAEHDQAWLTMCLAQSGCAKQIPNGIGPCDSPKYPFRVCMLQQLR